MKNGIIEVVGDFWEIGDSDSESIDIVILSMIGPCCIVGDVRLKHEIILLVGG